MTTRAAALATAMIMGLSGCGGSSGDKKPAAPTAAQFNGTVRTGPDRGYVLAGQIPNTSLHSARINEVTGTLVTGKGDVPMSATFTHRSYTLRFRLPPGGRSISGTGTVSGSGPSLALSRTGTLHGPRAGDAGDWVMLDGTYVGHTGTDPR